MFLLHPYIFPLFSAILEPDLVRIQRYLGCGFWLDTHGHFATCKHILDAVAKEQVVVIGNPTGPRSDYFIPVSASTSHDKYDVAVGKASAHAVGGVLKQYTGAVGLGLDVQAFGYTASGKQLDQIHIDPRLLRGHTSRIARESFGLPSPSLIEVSFGSPSGFSGTPLLVDNEVVGILYGNIDSKLQVYSIQEVVDGAAEYHETAYRIYEYGIAHNLSELQEFFAECGVGTANGV